jgi:DNA-binding transcriptional ArsR family regulator
MSSDVETLAHQAAVARGLADETRLRLLSLLQIGPATVSDLAARLDLPQPRVSAHLGRLRSVGLVSVSAEGRQRTYRVDRTRVEQILTSLGATVGGATIRSDRAEREVRRDSALRHARSCYGHLAGVAGVQLFDRLLTQGVLRTVDRGRPTEFEPTPIGRQWLRTIGVESDIPRRSRRTFAFGCMDWTERRYHLGGALGSALLDRLVHDGVFLRKDGTRALDQSETLQDWVDALG